MTKKYYFYEDHCTECNEKFTSKDIGGGRCLSCGTMICHLTVEELERLEKDRPRQKAA